MISIIAQLVPWGAAKKLLLYPISNDDPTPIPLGSLHS